MSKTTTLLAGLMLVGLIVSPALAQTTVMFKEQHISASGMPGTPDPTMSNYSEFYQCQVASSYSSGTQHCDTYESPSVYNPWNGSPYYTPLFDYTDMFGTATDTYDDGAGTISYVGQVPHGAVIHSATFRMVRTSSGNDMVDVSVHQVLDPDDLGHWGNDRSSGGDWDQYRDGAGWLTRDSVPATDVPWKNYEAGVDPVPTLRDVLDTAESTVPLWVGSGAYVPETWVVTNMTQNWADCLNARQGLAVTDGDPDGTGSIFCGKNSLHWRPDLEVSFTASLGGDYDKDGDVCAGDLGVFAANYGDETGLACWADGDFNGDGDVTAGDLGMLAANYGTGCSVPEPMTMTLLAIGGLALIRRRK